MSLSSVFSTTVSKQDPTSGHLGSAAPAGAPATSDFITVQSLANFAVMTGAITAAWGGAGLLLPIFHGRWFPFVLYVVFGFVSVLTAQKPDPPARAPTPGAGGLGRHCSGAVSGLGYRQYSLPRSTCWCGTAPSLGPGP